MTRITYKKPIPNGLMKLISRAGKETNTSLHCKYICDDVFRRDQMNDVDFLCDIIETCGTKNHQLESLLLDILGYAIVDTLKHLLTQNNINESDYIKYATIESYGFKKHCNIHTIEELVIYIRRTSCYDIASSMLKVIDKSFRWVCTPQGHDFWKNQHYGFSKNVLQLLYDEQNVKTYIQQATQHEP